jgi:small subunit ribosomal protein S19
MDMVNKSLKVPYTNYTLLNKIKLLNKINKKEIIKTSSRSSTILPIMVGHTLSIYNGNKHIPLFISEACFGHKLGEFSPTRNFISHKKNESQISNKKKRT